MKIALFGATGTVGSRVLAEAADRGHGVTAVVRDPARAPAPASEVRRGEVTDARSVALAVAGHDAVISAVGGAAQGVPQVVVEAAHALIDGLEQAGVARLIVVGGAGSLRAPDGGRLIDRPEFPEAWRAASLAQCDALDLYRARAGALDWTYLSPADITEPGERTGSYAVGGDEVVVDSDGHSAISTEDYAVALIDELERPAHIGRRFTVAYA